MSKNHDVRQIIAAVGAGVVVVSAIHNYIKTVETERQKRAQIEKEKNLQIQAIDDASKKVEMRIANGYYDGDLSELRLERIFVDLKFETMINRYDK